MTSLSVAPNTNAAFAKAKKTQNKIDINAATIEDFQIVNGCQTSNVIFHNRDKIDGVHIPFRLIGTKDEDFIFSIISGTNKQNPVRDEQFWSLLPFMKNLEEFARKEVDQKHIHLERRENQYRSETIEKARIVQMQPFFKAATAMLMGLPHRAARNLIPIMLRLV